MAFHSASILLKGSTSVRSFWAPTSLEQVERTGKATQKTAARKTYAIVGPQKREVKELLWHS